MKYKTTVIYDDGYVAVRYWDEYPHEYIERHQNVSGRTEPGTSIDLPSRTIAVEEGQW